MRMRFMLGWALVVGLWVQTPAQIGNLLTNGSFESGPDLGDTHDLTLPAGSTAIPGWSITGHSIDFNGPPWDVSHGSHAVDLDGRDAVLSGVEQTFMTVPGRTYVVSFDLSGNPEGPPVLKRLRVTIDGVAHHYEHDSSGQSEGSLIWQSLDFSFVASSTSATLSFVSLQDTPNSYGPLIDHVSVTEAPGPPPPCVYDFTSGTGASGIAFCVSANGTLVRLQSPAGQEHLDVGQVWEGYAVCTGTTVQAWDLSVAEDGFGSATVVTGPTATGVTLRRLSPHYRLDQAFKLDKVEKDVTITMTLTNISGASIPDVRLARAYDPDPNKDFDDDIEARSSRGVWAGDVDSITLTGTTWAVPTDTAVDTSPSPDCSPIGAATPLLTGDASLANVTYRLGNLAAGAKKKVVFVYRVQ